jgi:hypothetical protein
MAASQILKNTNATLEVTFSIGNADAGVTTTVKRADGTTLTSGAATQTAPTGHYTFTLAPQAELDSLTVTWAGTFGGTAQSVQTFAEIVGGYLFPLADLRTFGDQALASSTSYPDAVLRQAREEITDFFERVTECSFIPRYGRETLDGNGSTRLWLDKKRVNRLIGITVDGVALSAPELALVYPYSTGRIERDAAWSWSTRQNIVVSYEYGWPSTPAAVQRAALILARYQLVSNDISDRTISFANDLGTVRLSVPGMDYPTGIPVVDATLDRYDELDIPGEPF